MIGAFLPGSVDAVETCAPDVGESHRVVGVIDAETVSLDDGRDVRLMGALAPRPNALTVDAARWPPAQEALRALEALVVNRTVLLRFEGRRQDRYGRILAQLVIRDQADKQNGVESWVQRRLVAQGYARAYTLPGNAACLGALIAAENEARLARRGLWSSDVFRVFAATEVRALERLVGRFAVVEGRVADVTRTRRFTYINFGADWRTDFTVSLRTPAVDRSEGGEARAAALYGKTIRVRGWLERRNGPMIEAGTLDEIEVVEAAPEMAADAREQGHAP